MNRRAQRRGSPAPALAAAIVALLLGVAGAARAADGAVPWPTTGWEVSTPEAQGMSSSALADLVEYGAEHEMDSLLVVRHGRIVAESYYAPFRPGMRHLANSVTKAVLGTLAGIAVQSGEIASLDEPVLESFRWRAVANADGSKAQIKIAHLLDMTSGIEWNEPLSTAPPHSLLQMERSDDWVRFVLDRPMAHAPGTTFNYNTGDWQLLSAILTRKTGVDTLAYARRALFAPLGITDVTWRSDPQGIRTGGYGLSMQPRDLAKIGYLYLQRGHWAGQRIVAEAWTDRVFQAPIDMKLGNSPQFRYANGWWAIPDKRAYLAVGFLGQLIIVLPDADVVAVVTSRGRSPLLPLIDRIAAAASSKTALAPDAVGNARLAERVRDAAVEKATAVGPASSLAASISGKVWQFDRNPLGVRSLVLELTASPARYRVEFESARAGASVRRIEGPIGLDGFTRSAESGGQLLAVKGRWLGDDTFEIVSQSVTEGIVTSARLTFRGRDVDAVYAANQGYTVRVHGVQGE